MGRCIIRFRRALFNSTRQILRQLFRYRPCSVRQRLGAQRRLQSQRHLDEEHAAGGHWRRHRRQSQGKVWPRRQQCAEQAAARHANRHGTADQSGLAVAAPAERRVTAVFYEVKRTKRTARTCLCFQIDCTVRPIIFSAAVPV